VDTSTVAGRTNGLDTGTGNYEQTLASLEDGITDQAEADRIAAWLREAAKAEREAGEIFLTQGQ
jgi:hypothetical protein